MRASLNHYRQSPRKVRLVADLVRGKGVNRARAILAFTENKSAPALKKLIDSAVANADVPDAQANNLVIKEICVDQGVTMKRYQPMSRGRANQYRKRTSKIALMLGEDEKAKTTKKKVVAKKVVKKAAVKRAPKKAEKKISTKH